MSKKAAALSPPLPVPDEAEASPVAMVGLELTPKGYVVVSAVIRGDRVESRRSHGPPQLKHWAAGELKKVMLSKVLFPNGF